MNEERITGSPSWNDPRGQAVKTPDDVAAMVRLSRAAGGSSGSPRNWAAAITR